jgi:hypothetical protein
MLTNHAEHAEQFSHNMANRYLVGDAIRSQLIWENTCDQVAPTPYGFLVFDDTMVDKNSSHKIELVRRQYSGNAHSVIKGLGVMTCVYVNSETDQFWIIDIKGFPAQHKVKDFRVVLSAFGAAHGRCRDQRDGARQGGGRPRCVRHPLEGRAISPRNQANDRAGKLPM